MRLMSFAATIEQMRAGTKTVTRRLDAKGYWMGVLEPGTLICAVEKGQGIPKGEKVKRIGVIEIVDVRREPLRAIEFYDYERPLCLGRGWRESDALDPEIEDPRVNCGECYHGTVNEECRLEGFHRSHPGEWFVDLFCRINSCEPDVEVTRIEFRHRDDLTTCCGVERQTVYLLDEETPARQCPKCGDVKERLTTCCAAARQVYSGGEGTNHYECSACGEAV